MSPEAAAGRNDDVNAMSDVFGIGAVLYELLTKQPPYPGNDWRTILLLAIECATPNLARFRSGIPADLNAICLKCMAKQPELRYQTAKHVADDLQRFLDGSPVTARPTNLLSRTFKWCNNGWVRRSLAAAVAALLISTPIYYVSLLTALNKAVEAQIVAETKTRDESKARATAVATTGITLQSLRELVNEVQSRLRDVQATSSLRLEITELALERIDEAVQVLEDSPALDRLRAQALENKAEVFSLTGQNSKSLETRRKSLEIFNSIAQVSPTAESKFDVSLAEERIGDTLFAMEQPNSAVAHYKNAEEIRRGLERTNPTEKHRRGMLAILIRQTRLALRLQQFEKATELATQLKQLAGSLIDSVDYYQLFDRSVLHENLGDAYFETGKFEEARSQYQTSLRLRHNAEKIKSNWRLSATIANAYERMGKVSMATSKLDSANDWYLKSLDVRRTIVSGDASNQYQKQELARLLVSCGDVAERMGKRQLAEQHYSESRDHRESLSKLDPINPKRIMDLVVITQRIGDFKMSARQQAKQFFVDCLDLLQELDKSDPKVVSSSLVAKRRLSKIALGTGDSKSARQLCSDCWSLLELLIERKESGVQLIQQRSVIHELSGDIAIVERDLDKARNEYDSQRKLLESLPAESQNSWKGRQRLGVVYQRLCDVCGKQGDWDNARKWFMKALAISDQRIAKKNDTAALTDAVALWLRGALIEISDSKFELAVQWLDRGLDKLEELKKAEKLPARFEIWLKVFTCEKEYCLHAMRGFPNPEECKNLPLAIAEVVLLKRAKHFVDLENLSEVLNSADTLVSKIKRDTGDATADNWYFVACVCSIAATAIDNLEDRNSVLESEGKSSKHYQSLAIQFINRAINSGFNKKGQLLSNIDLNGIRSLPEFESILERLEPQFPMP